MVHKTHFEFIIVAFDRHYTRARLVDLVQKCNANIKDCTILFQADTQLVTVAPNFREGTLKMYFEVDIQQDHLTVKEVYSQLARDWIHVISECVPSYSRPWMIFQNLSAFPRIWDATQTNVKVDEFALGTLAQPSKLVVHFRCPGSVSSAVECSTGVVADFFHDIKTAEFYFDECCKMVLTYDAIRDIVVSYGANAEIFLNLVHPMLVYELEVTLTRTHATRVQTIPFFSKSLPCSVLGKATTLRLRFVDQYIAQKLVSRLQYRCGQIPVKYTAMSSEHVTDPDALDSRVNLPDFQCRYLLSAIVGRSYVLQLQNYRRWGNVISAFEEWFDENPTYCSRTLVELIRLVDDGVVSNNFIAAAAMLMEHYRQAVVEDPPVPLGSCMVPQVTITPTRFILWPPQLMTNNRILRNFDSGFGLRVSFREDNMSKLNIRPSSLSSRFFDLVIRKRCLEGLDIAGRHYDFLAWSNSQLREHGIWMYAEDSRGNTAAIIREWMGDFSQIPTVSKFMARMGQCFSQTEDVLDDPVNPLHVVTLPDIVGGLHPESKKPYCFSDGVGQISKALVEQICASMGLPDMRCAFQIRYAGYKGMLVLNPNLTDVDIVFRESMKKFPCTEAHRLEIVKPCSPVGVDLNRQLITILDHMRVLPSVFLKLQENMLMSLTEMLMDDRKAASQLTGTCKLPLKFEELVESGICITTEPFFRSMLLALHRSSVDLVKTKARINIDPSLGRYMFGVVDETATLEYGQVFVQYSKSITEKDGETLILTGRVMVTKSPSLMPGDVRILEAVDIPELHHIVDCIVFPQKGHRPHPDEMAALLKTERCFYLYEGSDLDGDEYTVIWNQDLFFRGDNAPPETYPAPIEQRCSKAVTVEDMVDCLCNYVRNDHIGVLGNAHLAMADNPRHGLNSDTCRSLARKFTLAIDAAKTGVYLPMERCERVTCYPDFMEKGERATSYRSPHVLGKLYRVCRDFEEVNRSSSIVYGTVKKDIDLFHPGWPKYRDSAIASRDKYSQHLESILSSFGVTHEGEAIANAYSKLHSKFSSMNEKNRADIEELITKAIERLWEKTSKDFWREFEESSCGDEQAIAHEEVLRKASAWYVVTYSEGSIQPKYLSFPWVVSKQLAQIKAIHALDHQRSPFVFLQPLFITNLDQLLASSEKRLVELDPKSSNLLKGSCIDISPMTLELAARLLLQWSRHWKLCGGIESQESYSQLHSISNATLLRNFLHFVSDEVGAAAPSSSVGLFLKFLRFLVPLRFMNKEQAYEKMPVQIPRHKHLGKVAMRTYHCIAVQRNLAYAGIEGDGILGVESHEMEPLRIPMFVVRSFKNDRDFNSLKAMLKTWTGVSVVHLREQQSSLMISAAGPIQAIGYLKILLQKDAQFLKKHFEKGSLF